MGDQIEKTGSVARAASALLDARPGSARLNWLDGPGEMHGRIRAFDWAEHPLGVPESWPQNLSTAVSISLCSRFPIILYWGRDLHVFYNDAYIPIFGAKHPALGRTCREVWAEIWDVIGPMFQQVLEKGEATWSDDQLLLVQRAGYLEEAYFTWSFSPILSDAGQVEGVFTAVFETTSRVLGERRLQTLRELGANATLVRTIDEACARFIQTLDQNPADVPFALLYLLDECRQKAVLKGTVRVPENHPARANCISLDDPAERSWPLGQVLKAKRHVVLSELRSGLGTFYGGRWPESPSVAVVMPIPGTDPEYPIGFLVMGVSPRRALNDDYEGFFQLVAGHGAAAISNAQSHENEQRRLRALAELDRAKTTFFSNVSHEFRTPLTLMLGPLEEVLNGVDGSLAPKQREHLDATHRNSLRLLKLVNSLLDFSRIEAGRLQAQYQPTDLPAFTSELSAVFRAAVEKAGIRLVVDCPALAEPVFVDRDMWEKIVLNLLSNAFKFTFEGQITVEMRGTGNGVELRVRDTGVGIPEHELGNLFKRFHRVEEARGRTLEGSGIGLALVQELVKLQGGTITVESTLGKGTEFRVALPVGKAHLEIEGPRAKSLVPARTNRAEAFVEEALRWLPEDGGKLLGGAVSAPVDGEGQGVASDLSSDYGRKPRVLVADDNADMRDYLRRLLQPTYEVIAVGDGRAALAAARTQPPDLILSDVMMPQLDGFGLLQTIRSDPELCTVPVILLSARAGEESRVEGLHAGADDYLIKPFSARELMARVESHLRMAQLRREAFDLQQRLQQSIQAQDRQFHQIVSLMPAAVYTCDMDGRITFFNRKAAELWGREPRLNDTDDEFCGSFRLWTVDGTPLPHNQTPMATAVREGTSSRNREVVIQRPDGSQVIVSANIDPLYDAGGKRCGAINVFQDITERVRAKERLEQTVTERTASLREAIAQMEEFSYTVSHDLRAPLRGMLGYSEALLKDFGAVLPAEAVDYAQRIAANAKRLDKMVLDLLIFSRVARAEMRLEPVKMDELVRAIVEQYPGMGAPDALIEVGPLHEVLGHEPSLTQALSNLLSNAIKFVPPGVTPKISVWSERQDGKVRVWVADNGIGVDPKHQQRLFTMFERIHPDMKYEGTGVGLAIVRKAVERMGGKAGMESDGASGSRFWIELGAVEGA